MAGERHDVIVRKAHACSSSEHDYDRRRERPRRLRRRRLPHPDRAAPRRALSGVRPDDLSAQVLAALLARNPDVPPDAVADVVWGAANQAGEDNRNVARMAVLLAGLPLSVPGATVNRLVRLGPRRRQPGCRRPRPRSRRRRRGRRGRGDEPGAVRAATAGRPAAADPAARRHGARLAPGQPGDAGGAHDQPRA